ncbi:MAG: hypothetical protein JST45_10045, partial [Bacteroidetes bacterium]|nr:hypothetical protein [Bacteroidota bacterium]
PPLLAQVCLNEEELPVPPSMLGGGGGFYETRHGRYLPTRGALRVLVVLVEVDYQTPGEPDPTGTNGYPGWPAHQLPVWLDNADPTENLFDSEVLPSPQGSVTRYYQQASSGALHVIADYLMAPTNNGIFSVPSSTGYFPSLGPVIAVVDSVVNGNFNTYFQHGINDFDHFTINGSATAGLEKVNPSTENPAIYDHLCFIFRNSRNRKLVDTVYVYTEMDQTGSTAPGSPGSIAGHASNTYSRFAAYNKRPTDIFRHEFGHNLYGGNKFHYAGGGDGTSGMYWVSYSGGWGNMGLHNCSIESWSAWDRLQMGWKNVGQVNQIAARNPGNTSEANGELDASVPSDAGTYVLRDFVQTGDAIRIKLPFTDPVNEYPEYLWVENHQGKVVNNCPRQGSTTAPCLV